MTDTIAKRPPNILDVIFYAVSISLFLVIFWYYWTGTGGPTLLAMTLVPVVYVMFTLQALRDNDLYPALPPIANYVIAFAYCAFSFYCAYYMNTEYMALGLERAGAWNTTDLIMGGVMTLLIMEYARKRHMPLFILNIVLILYAVYGNWVPGMFYHAGLTWERLVTASSVEVATGIFSRLPQIALTTVGSFLLVLEPAARLRLHPVAAARDQARGVPLAARHSAVGGGRLDVRRHGERLGRRQRHHHRLGHDPGDDRLQHPAGDRGGDRIRLLARRPVDAAGDGYRRLPDGRIPRRRLFRRGGARLGAGADLLRDGRPPRSICWRSPSARASSSPNSTAWRGATWSISSLS